MRKSLFVKKIIALSLCAALLLPAGTMAAEENLDAAVSETAAEENLDAAVSETAAEENLDAAVPETAAEENLDTAVPETAAEENLDAAVPETAAEESLDAAEAETASEALAAPAEKNASVGCALKYFKLYNGGEVTMNVENLKMELDFAEASGFSGIRLLVGGEETETGYIAVSCKDDTILVAVHGGFSGKTMKYKVDTETLTNILDSNAFDLFLRGTDDTEAGTALDAPETDESASEETNPETAVNEPEETNSETDESTAEETNPETAMSEPEETGHGTEENATAETNPETTGSETEGTGSGGLTINGISFTDFAELVNEAYILLNESIVKNEVVESEEGSFRRSGIVLDRKHMERLLEIASELGIDGGMKKKFDAENIRPEGCAVLWGADDKDYKAAAGSFGISVGEEEPVWNTFGADIVGKEITFYNYRTPGQQSAEIESGVEAAFGMVDLNNDTSWLPVDDTDAVDLAELVPAEAIEKVSADVQTVLYDMMAGVLSAVLEEMPEEMVADILEAGSMEDSTEESLADEDSADESLADEDSTEESFADEETEASAQ